MQAGGPSLRDLFERARDLHGGERDRFLADLEATRRAHVERLLAAADTESGDGALNVDPAALVAALDEPPTPPLPVSGQQVGPWQLIALIGEGGSSTVFRAMREHAGVRQEAALKLLRRGLYTTEAQRAFRHERQALSQLSHPDIASLIEGGVTENGLAYIVLELVDGVPITEHARARTLNVRARLLLFLRVCRAVEAAHRALIVHRDLKPSNVLVTAEGHVKLLDFGIAKLLDADDETQTKLPAFTAAYAAPEQRSGALITTATDVYALGILLGEMMTGQRLGTGGSRTPSGRVDDNCEAGVLPATAKITRKQLRGDLDNIVLKAIAEEPGRRYASAGALADEIERLLDGRPVVAHPPSRWYRTRKFVQRHRGAVVITALFMIAIFSALGLALWQANVARNEAQRANAVRDFVEHIFDPVREGVAEGKTPSIRDLVASSIERLGKNTALPPAARVDLSLMFSTVTDAVGDRPGARHLADAANELAAATLDRLDPLAIQALTKHGSLAARSADYAIGEPALREAERRLSASGARGVQVANVLDTLAMIEFDSGNAQASLVLEQRALDERLREFGPESREAANGYNNLGYGLEGVGRFDDAAAAYQRCYELDARYRDPESYPVLMTLSNWASTLLRAGHVRKARELLAQANVSLDKLGGKPRYSHLISAGKLCQADTLLYDMAAAERDCAHMFELVSHSDSGNDSVTADIWRMEAARALDSGHLAEARAAAEKALALYGDVKENRERRDIMLHKRAEIEWLASDADSARDDALAARATFLKSADIAIAFSFDAIPVLACARAPAPSCPAGLEATFAANMETNAANPNPRMLLAWIVLARRQLDRGEAARARITIDRGIENTRAELGDVHPLLRAAQVWRAVALDAEGKCAEAAQARVQLAGSPTAGDAFPWLSEATVQLPRLTKCPAPPLSESH